MMTPEKLRQIYGNPTKAAEEKVISHLDWHCQNFIKNSSLVILASSNGKNLDISPKGVSESCVKIENDKTLALPDRPGNNRIDGLLNIIRQPQVSLLFFVFSVNEKLRIQGKATIVDTEKICSKFALNGKVPKTVTIINVEKAFFHCGKALSKSKVWQPSSWPVKRPIDSLTTIINKHKRLN